MCTSRALALCPLGFPVDPERMAVAAPCARDRRPPAGASSPAPAVAQLLPSPPGSSVRCLTESISTINSDRARPLSGGSVN
eukprot:6213703-Pleurochrysis_carterae.AAC.2